ncbi:MAG: MarR family transcriptional regulator [Sulfurimonas sp.]|uniref:MarR family winged helix-turn-helix transcriptional regulator n=1 Tax=Sulfurimonas sp. TaxID=2022749 RepID=UPI0026341135|nr:MarR family transcriptional regulator [Sulfurimonas sp.]MCW8895955.1 MarR family transcriptional regulator [Sulfurimonas sp.]MCW8954798.1 MarR family transcriptional regulator [Sulfurimonas sp.]MCW9067254.1 MarR family transcriptional regulator [Sulfurimonas sp.]
MKKNRVHTDLITNFYDKVSNGEFPEVFLMTFPIALIQKTVFAHAESFLKEKFDMLNSEVDVLASLFTHGKILSPTQLYDLTIFSSGGMTKVLKKLEAKGFIYRKKDENDKRCMLVCLTQSGEDIVLKSLNEISKECSKYFEAFSEEEKKLFASLLKKVLLNINRVD